MLENYLYKFDIANGQSAAKYPMPSRIKVHRLSPL